MNFKIVSLWLCPLLHFEITRIIFGEYFDQFRDTQRISWPTARIPTSKLSASLDAVTLKFELASRTATHSTHCFISEHVLCRIMAPRVPTWMPPVQNASRTATHSTWHVKLVFRRFPDRNVSKRASRGSSGSKGRRRHHCNGT